MGLPPWAIIAEVDDAVRSVLSTRGRGPESGRPTSGAEVFAGRLLALRQVEAMPGATREVRVAPGTVVTPLARDLLKTRGIALRMVARAEVARVRHPGEWGFAIIEEGAESGTIAAMRRTLIEGEWAELEGSLGEALRWVAEVPHRGAMVLTEEASVAVWQACQVAGVRAASVADPDAVARAVRRLGMNLMVVEPRGKSISWMKQLGLTFRRAGAPAGIDREEGRRCGSPR
jgi:hypothetical protein